MGELLIKHFRMTGQREPSHQLQL